MTESSVAGMKEFEWERKIAVLEHRVQELTDASKAIDGKLDELLQLRSRGMGAFWLASSILGTGIVGAVFALIQMMKGSL